MASGECVKWREAIDLELAAMADLDVWDVVHIPVDHRLLGMIWIFRKKVNSNGVISKFKARLCAQGSRQIPGQDVNKTYAPTGGFATLRAALLVGLSRGYSIHQMDAKKAFLNGVLDEEIYLRVLASMLVPPGHCLKLRKAIYGLRQAPRVWYAALLKFFKSINFAPSPADPCLFTSQVSGWECFVHVYVDDMVIISPDVNRFKKLISKEFRMEDLGELNHLLGVRVLRVNKKALFLS